MFVGYQSKLKKKQKMVTSTSTRGRSMWGTDIKNQYEQGCIMKFPQRKLHKLQCTWESINKVSTFLALEKIKMTRICPYHRLPVGHILSCKNIRNTLFQACQSTEQHFEDVIRKCSQTVEKTSKKIRSLFSSEPIGVLGLKSFWKLTRFFKTSVD